MDSETSTYNPVELKLSPQLSRISVKHSTRCTMYSSKFDYSFKIAAIIIVMGAAMVSAVKGNQTLFDFTSMENVSSWVEQSDTVRTVGKSKAVITLQKTQEFQRAVFFTLLNPQPNGAGFAGVRTETNFNLEGITNINIDCRGQGENDGYKIVLRHKGEDNEPYPTYEQFFTAPMSSENFSTVSLPLANFKAYYRGREINDADPLDVTSITNFGLQVYGGVYETDKQKGVSSLEINSIDATI